MSLLGLTCITLHFLYLRNRESSVEAIMLRTSLIIDRLLLNYIAHICCVREIHGGGEKLFKK